MHTVRFLTTLFSKGVEVWGTYCVSNLNVWKIEPIFAKFGKICRQKQI